MKKRLAIIAMAVVAISSSCSDDDPIIPYEVFGPNDPYILNMKIDGMDIDSAIASTASATCTEKSPINLIANNDGSISVELPIPNDNIEAATTTIGDTIISRRQYSLRINVDRKKATFKVGMEIRGRKNFFGTSWWYPYLISMNGKELYFDRDADTCYVKLKLANGKIVPAEL